MTYVRAFYDVRERQELARLDSCEVLESPMASEVSYARAVALGHIAELLDELLPDREANDAIFRLTLSVLHVLDRFRYLDAGYVFRSVADALGRLPARTDRMYRLRPRPERQPRLVSRTGRRPDVPRRQAPGILRNFQRVARASRANVSRPGGKLRATPWPKAQAADLRKFLIQILQRHLEKKLVTAGMLEKGAF